MVIQLVHVSWTFILWSFIPRWKPWIAWDTMSHGQSHLIQLWQNGFGAGKGEQCDRRGWNSPHGVSQSISGQLSLWKSSAHTESIQSIHNYFCKVQFQFHFLPTWHVLTLTFLQLPALWGKVSSLRPRLVVTNASGASALRGVCWALLWWSTWVGWGYVRLHRLQMADTFWYCNLSGWLRY